MSLNKALLLVLSACAYGQGVAYTFNSSGLTALSHDGQSYLGSTGALSIYAGYFGPDQTLVNYTTTSKTLQASGYTVRYNSGIAGDTTFQIELAGTGTDTFEWELCITNNDTLSRSLSGLNTDTIFALSTPSVPVISSDASGGPVGWRSYGATTFFAYNTGTISCYLDTYLNLDFNCTTLAGAVGKMLVNIRNLYGTENAIEAGASKCTTLKLKWGAVGESMTVLGKDGYEAFRAERPQAYKFPNRNIAAYMIIADGVRTAGNPRGYQVSGGTPDWFGSFAATRTTFLSKMQSYINNAVAIVPRAPFLIVWDIEGQEFNHVFTYVGYPGDTDRGSMLQYLAPEMETTTNGVPLADELFALIRANGLEPGMTIRPHNIQVGATPPTDSCLSQGPFEGDVFVDYSSTSYSDRGYECQEINVTSYDDGIDTVSASGYSPTTQFRNNITVRFYAASGGVLPVGIVSGDSYGMCNIDNTAKTFTVATDITCATPITDFSGSSGTTYFEYWKGPRNVSVQRLLPYEDGLAILRKKIQYAINRWGIKVFYIDSTYFSTGLTGSVIIHNQVWADLLAEFPTTIFIPENSPGGGYTGKYGNFIVGNYGRNPFTTQLYPDYVPYLAVSGNQASYDANATLVMNSIAGGVPYLLNVQVSPSVSLGPSIQASYVLAAALNSKMTVVNSATNNSLVFQSAPGTSFPYQLSMRVYFADTANNLAASTTYCTRKATDSCYASGVLQSTAMLDLSATPYYQIRYYDFAGNLVSNPGNYGTIQ